MAQPTTWRARRISFMNRLHARKAGRSAVVTAFVSAPEPRTMGNVARGRQLIAGNFLFSGVLAEGPDLSIWEVAERSPAVVAEIHGCAWLDDLAAVGDERARQRAQDWVFGWIKRYDKGRGPGWVPGLTGRRLIRWINHGFFLLRGRNKTDTDLFYRSLARQTLFLSRRWKVAAPGLPRFEALAGTVYAGLALEGMERHVDQATAALAKDCTTAVDPQGGIATRNPEELLDILSLLNWTIGALNETKRKVPAPLLDAVERIAPTLRALRHANGGLARFHGGGPGFEGRLDEALAASGVKSMSDALTHMGFLRVTGGRTTLIVDAAPPSTGPASASAHASTLAIELTSGRRPMIVNCGAGSLFGEEWKRASRATSSHATLGIEGTSSSKLDDASEGPELLTSVPTLVECQAADGYDDRRFEMSHNGYRKSHGLTHGRILDLSVDGRALEGEDVLAALDDDDQVQFDQSMQTYDQPGIPYTIRFHLHPDVDATLDLGERAVSLMLKSGELWLFRHDGTASLNVAPSVYLENGRLKPRTSQQVVLTGRAMSYAERIRWSLSKAQSTPNVVRDLVQAEPVDALD